MLFAFLLFILASFLTIMHHSIETPRPKRDLTAAAVLLTARRPGGGGFNKMSVNWGRGAAI